MAEPPDLSGFGNLAGMFDPQMMANLQTQSVLGGAAQGLLAAGGPSPYPIDIGTALGRGIGGAVQGQQEMPWMKQLGAMMQMRQMAIESSIMQHVMNGGGIPGLTDTGQGPADTGGGQAPGSPQMPATGAPTPLVQTTSGAENPYNIGNVEAKKGSPTRFAQPQSWGEGVGLTTDLAKTYPGTYNGGKPMSIQQIAQHWTEDNKGPWAFNVSRGSGLSPDQPIDLTDPMTAAKFARGVHLAEKDQKSSPIQPVDAYLPGAQGPTFQMPRSAGQQVAQAGAPTAGAAPVGMPPPPARIPIPPVVQSMLLSPRFKAMGEAAVKEIERRNDRNMELYKMDPRVKAVEAAATARAGIQPKVEEIQATSGPAAAAAAAKETATTQAKINAEKQALYPPEWQGKTGEQLRAVLPPNVRGVVDMLYSGDTTVGQLPARANALGVDPSKINFMQLTKDAYPDWDPNIGEARKEFTQDVFNQSKQWGQIRSSVNVFYQHAAQYQDLVRATGVGDTPMVNKVLKAWNDQTGNPKFTNAEALQHFLATELARAVKGGGQLNESEVEHGMHNLDLARSWGQASGTLEQWMHAIGAREKNLTETADSLGVPKATIDKFFGPSAQKARDHFWEVNQQAPTSMPSATTARQPTVKANPLLNTPPASSPIPHKPTAADIDYLKKNPGVRSKFEARFGPADQYLK